MQAVIDGSDQQLTNELRSIMERAAEITEELTNRGWTVFTCVSLEKGHKHLTGHATVRREQTL